MLLYKKQTNVFSQVRETSISPVAVSATANRIDFHSFF